MMMGLFALYALALLLAFFGQRKSACGLAFLTLALSAFMLIHHATSNLGIRV